MRVLGPYIGRRPQLPFAGVESDVAAVVGGEVAAETDSATGTTWRSIGIGVATGALTFIVTRMLENIFFPKGRS